jgi:chemotaxis signal transduction protein
VERRAAGMAFQLQHPSLRGFHTFRGETLAVIDLLALLELPPSEAANAGSHLLIVGSDASNSVALVVDDIVSMEPLARSELQPISPGAVRQPALYAGSLVSEKHGITLVLEATALLEAARIVDHRLFARASVATTAEASRPGAARAQYIVYGAGGGVLASTLGALDSIIEFPDDFVDLRQPGTPLVGLCDRHGTSVQVLDLGAMMGRPPLESVRRRPVLVLAGERGLEGFMVDQLAFLQDATPVPLPGRNRGTIGLIAAPTEMIRARRGDTDVSATVLSLESLTGIAAAA